MIDRLRQARLIWPSVASLVGLAILMGLGCWQLQRRQWKEELLVQIAERVAALPTDLAAVEQRQWNGDIEYLHVEAKGRFHHDKERYLYAPGPAALGWHVYTPLEIAPRRILWVNRGWVDDAHKLPAHRATVQEPVGVEVRGLLRKAGPPAYFAPANDEDHNLWYWPDLSAMTASAFGAADVETLPFRLEADPAPTAPDGLPKGGATRLEVPNRHLEYAVTWFGLALTLIGVYLTFAASKLGLVGGGE